jgi:hypothetical protein
MLTGTPEYYKSNLFASAKNNKTKSSNGELYSQSPRMLSLNNIGILKTAPYLNIQIQIQIQISWELKIKHKNNPGEI